MTYTISTSARALFRYTTLIFTSLLLLVFSCNKKDKGAKTVSIENVTRQEVNNTTEVLNYASVGQLIRINGVGFTTVKAVYFNGVNVSVNPGYVKETSIIATVPSTLPYGGDVKDTSKVNTIRIVTEYDDYTYHFVFIGPAPTITGVSHTLPKAGEKFEIYGTYFRDLDTIRLPGNTLLAPGDYQILDSNTRIVCTLTAAAVSTPGSIYIHGTNGSAYSYNYLNWDNCIFIRQFTADSAVTGDTGACYQRVYNYGSSTISATKTDLLPATGTGHKNPAYYRQFPITPGDAGLEATVGSFDFRTCPAVTSVLKTSGGKITAATLCSNLAVQYDVYIPVDWSSGYFRFEFIKGSSDWRNNYASWAVNGSVKPVSMKGWQTVSVPLSSFKALNGKTLQYLIDQGYSKGGYFAFINGAYSDAGGKSYAANVIKNFQVSFGNFRIVPYVKGK